MHEYHEKKIKNMTKEELKEEIRHWSDILDRRRNEEYQEKENKILLHKDILDFFLKDTDIETEINLCMESIVMIRNNKQISVSLAMNEFTCTEMIVIREEK